MAIGLAHRHGAHVSFLDFMKVGSVITLGSLVIASFYLSMLLRFTALILGHEVPDRGRRGGTQRKKLGSADLLARLARIPHKIPHTASNV